MVLTGEGAVQYAIAYLGVTQTDGGGQPYQALYAHGEMAVKAIMQELYLQENGVPFSGVFVFPATLPLSETAANVVLPFGVAMMLAANIGDTALEASMRGLYRQKRGLLSHFIPKPDVLPVSEGC